MSKRSFQFLTQALAVPKTLPSFSNLVTVRSLIKMADNVPVGPVATTITEKLSSAFEPSHLEVINESYMHNVPPGSETHFKVVVVSDKFKEIKTPIQRHRSVNDILKDELNSGVHALSIVAKTPEQWEAMGKPKVDPSPKCRGGFGK